MVGLWRFSFFFYRSNCLRELNSILYPLRITSCHINVIDAEHANRTAREVLFVKLTFANARSVSEWLVELAGSGIVSGIAIYQLTALIRTESQRKDLCARRASQAQC